jgi:ribosomal protein L22
MYGIAERRLVITVAAQKDICPQGKTYPRKAVRIVRNIKVTPIDHVSEYLKDLKYKPRPMWKYRHTKNNEAPLA